MVEKIEAAEGKITVTLSFSKHRDPLAEYLIGSAKASIIRNAPAGTQVEIKTIIKDMEPKKKPGLDLGFKEVEGIHSRTDFDLSQHAKFSGRKIEYFDPESNESYTPYVIETSIGVDRMFLSIMCHSYEEEKLENGETRVVLKLPAALAPTKLAVMPLVKKDGLPEKAREIMDSLKFHFNCKYDEKDSIGKRYRRQDAVGTPYCITIDHDSLKDDCVTLRDRDTMEQQRVKIADLRGLIEDKVSITSLLKKQL
jgi:glycyl-tRNA synthetase